MRRKCSILPTLLLNLSGRGACFYAMYSSEGSIFDVNLRMLIKRILIHQNEDKSLDIKFEMNGEFSDTVRVFIDPMGELESA